MYKEMGEEPKKRKDRLKGVLCSKNIWHHWELMVDPDVLWGPHPSESTRSVRLARPHWVLLIPKPRCVNANIVHVQKNKEQKENNCHRRSWEYALTSVLWVRMRVFLYIQNSEAAIWGFSPKTKQNTDVEKNRTCTRDLWFNTPTHWQICFTASLSLFASLCGFCFVCFF